MSNRNIVVDRLRALAMLGVIGIHIGPFVFASSTPRLDLFLLFQVFTRFAVPSFFFISGFGLFCNDALHRPFHYFNFIKKHLITVGLPYFVWSFFYIAMWQWEDMYRPDRSFSVLLYFYFSMPFWRWLVRWISEKSAAGIAASLSVLAALQILLYQWSATYWNYPPWTQGHAMIIRLLNERMNYLPLFYGFIFVLGGVCAIHEKKLRSWLQCHFTSSLGVFLLSCALLVWKFKQYVLAGIPLAVCWLLFFSAALEKLEDADTVEDTSNTVVSEPSLSHNTNTTDTNDDYQPVGATPVKENRRFFLDTFSDYSMIIYLIHPLFVYYWYQWFGLLDCSIAQVPVLLYYALVLTTSLLVGVLIHKIAKRCRIVGLLLLGRVPK